MALGIIPGDLDSVAKAFADLKADLDSWLKLKLMC
jgi:hypothetical protein